MTRSNMLDRTIMGLLIVALGVMFLLDTTSALGADTKVFGTYWPVLLIGWGLSGIISSGFRFRLWPTTVLIIGVVSLLSNLNLWSWNVGQLWPVILVIVGLALAFNWRGRGTRGSGWFARRKTRDTGQETGNGEVRASHIFGGGKERVTSQDFTGGELSAIFGGMEIDLREAGFAGGKATIDATVLCGGIEFRVPKNWTVNLQVTTLLGGTENRHQQPSPEDSLGELTITGTVVCGGIEVKDSRKSNYPK